MRIRLTLIILSSLLICLPLCSSAQNTFPLTTATNYHLRIDGALASDAISIGLAYRQNAGIAVGDLNGDGLDDIAIASNVSDNNGTNTGSVWVLFSTLIDDFTGTGNNLDLATSTNYNIRYDGPVGAQITQEGALAIGDVNGDGLGDLIIGSQLADLNGTDSGAAYVIFSTLIDDVGTTTGNNKPLTTATNYNIRYDGSAADRLTDENAIAIGDVNGDGLGDLVLGAQLDDNNGTSSGSAYVMFSTLIDDVGTSTGNNMPLTTAANYNIRYDGVTSNLLTDESGIAIGDLNGDGLSDLVLGAQFDDNNGASSGSAYVMFSTLIDNVGTSTGNNKPLTTAANYNIRYNGPSGSLLTDEGAIKIGDLNGDGLGDLVLGAQLADNVATDSGSAYVMFSTLIDDVGSSTGNSKDLTSASNYNIRYDGTSANRLTDNGAIMIGDINGDLLGDLVLGAPLEDNNGASSGSVFVMFSTLIDDVGTSTGNDLPLATTSNFNIRYDGVTSNTLAIDGAMAIGDINGNHKNDLILGTRTDDNDGTTSGSAYLLYETTIDDVDVSTNNVKVFSSTTDFNARYDGPSGDALTQHGAIRIADLNADGIDDLIVGALANDENSRTTSGSAWIIFGTKKRRIFIDG